MNPMLEHLSRVFLTRLNRIIKVNDQLGFVSKLRFVVTGRATLPRSCTLPRTLQLDGSLALPGMHKIAARTEPAYTFLCYSWGQEDRFHNGGEGDAATLPRSCKRFPTQRLGGSLALPF